MLDSTLHFDYNTLITKVFPCAAFQPFSSRPPKPAVFLCRRHCSGSFGEGIARLIPMPTGIPSTINGGLLPPRGACTMANEIIMTKEGYDDLVRELNELKTTRRAEISEKIRVARGFGDLSENSEYDEAKNEQAIVEARILTLENQLKNVKIVEKSAAEKGTVSIGSFVTIRDVEFGDELTYRIISSVESSSDMSTITDESPVGKALLGHKAGDSVMVTVPSGAKIEYQVVNVE